MPTAAGHDVRVTYLHEDNGFAASPTDSTYKTFGRDVQVTTLQGSNNAVRVFDPNTRKAQNVIEQQFQGSFTVEFKLTNAWWLQEILTSSVSTSGSGPYVHTYDGSTPSSFQMVVGNESTSNERTLKGCVANTCEISADVGGLATVTIEGAYGDEEEANTLSQTQTTPSYRVMHFANGQIKRGGSTLSLIQNMSLSIENNIDLIYEMGSRSAVDYSPKKHNLTLDYGDIVDTDDEIARMYGDSAATSPETKVDNSVSATMIFDNGESGTAINKLTLNMSTVLPDSYGRSGSGDPEANLQGAMSEIPASFTADYENGDSTAK